MRLALVTLIVTILLTITGCGSAPVQEENISEEMISDEEISEEVAPQQESDQQDGESTDDAEDDSANETETETSMAITGNLELQDDLSKCPHLIGTFECDRYDISRCYFKTFIGKEDFFPDYIYCRDGRIKDGERNDWKYCFIQECRPLKEENIVKAYGGPVTWGEYKYSVEKVGGGIMTYYELISCGEEYDEFETSFDCRTYRSELGNI